ncbi:MAG: hypothetical protein E7544_07120 [Ruminococcaceae bacterium]|nr:hypothetical protein [Oscillospiraceae bacterium]
MKKTLAIVLSVVMLLGVLPFASFAAEPAYDRAAIAANDEAYIDSLNAEQIASVILDWVDREIAKYSEDIKAAVVEGVVENGFEGFEISAFGDVIAAQIPDIDSLDAVVGYKGYLAELGGDFAKIDASALVTRAEAGSALGFIDGVFQLMADNSEIFGKVFRWDDQVFDYGKVGAYIETLNGSENADEQAIYDFYIDYLIGNDIQAKFTKWVADQMNYAIPEGETFDDTLNNGILGWFVGLCEQNGILSADAIAELETYDLRTNDIYTLVKDFVVLAQGDNQVKLDTYYNYLLDTVVRTLLKTTLGQVASVGAEAEVPAAFADTYKDLALLEEISGGKVYFKDGDAYYEVTVAGGAVTAKTLTWTDALNINFEAPTATIYTGKNCDQEVQVYRPTSKDNLAINLYATAKNQALMADMVEIEFAGEAVAEEYAALMTEANAKALADSFGITVAQGEEIISELKLTFAEIEEYVEDEAAKAAKTMAESTLTGMGMDASLVTVEAVDVVVNYRGYATEDEFICEVVLSDATVKLGGSLATFAQSVADSAAKSAISSMIDADPVVTVVVDGLSGNLNIDDAKALLDFIDTDFAIDADLLDFAGNYDAYNGVVGQANHILYGLVDMLVSDAGMEKLALVDGNNDNFTANLEKVCATANDMMAAAEEVINNEEYKDLAGQIGIDIDAILANFDTELLYKIDFSSVEALWVSVITLGLDLVDDGSNELIKEIHALIGDLTNLDAMAVAVADYALADCIPALNKTFADAGVDFALTVPAATDAKAVADGAGKDIIMTKAVDLIYEAAVKGVALVNTIANDALEAIGTEIGMEMPTVAFDLGVAKGADWEATLAALVARVYELADGIILACAEQPADTIDAISKVANAILPLGSLASNCASESYAFDGNKVMGFLFDDGLEGDLDGFLRLFETKEKTEDVAADVSVTEALIKASEHIVDAFFPDTVKSELYIDNYSTGKFTEITVQEYFTGAENDAVIASNNMDSLNALKADLVPAALNLVREAGVLPFFAKCDKDHTAADLETVTVAGKAATCTEEGVEDAVKCAECGYVVSGGKSIPAKNHAYTSEVTKAPTCTEKGVRTYTCANDAKHTYTEEIAATGHVTWSAWTVTVAPTCEGKGMETRTCVCGKTETRDIAATGHPDADGNKICDVCGHDWNEAEEEEDNSFFGKIKAFFQKIIDWFKNLFK